MGGAEWAALASGVAGAIAVVLTSFRKRRDVDFDEMKKRITDQANRLADAEEQIGHLRAQLVKCEASAFELRRLLAMNVIEDPTKEIAPRARLSARASRAGIGRTGSGWLSPP